MIGPGKEVAAFFSNEIGNTYVSEGDRFVVSLIVGYGIDERITSAREAAIAAVELTKDDGSGDTHWYVYDRLTGEMECFEQQEIDSDFDRFYETEEDEENLETLTGQEWLEKYG